MYVHVYIHIHIYIYINWSIWLLEILVKGVSNEHPPGKHSRLLVISEASQKQVKKAYPEARGCAFFVGPPMCFRCVGYAFFGFEGGAHSRILSGNSLRWLRLGWLIRVYASPLRLNGRQQATPLRASQNLSDAFPRTDYQAFEIQRAAPRDCRVALVGS